MCVVSLNGSYVFYCLQGLLFFVCYMGNFYRNPKGLFIVELSNNKAKNIKGMFNITILKRKQ